MGLVGGVPIDQSHGSAGVCGKIDAVANAPQRVTWSDHALVKARFLGVTHTDIEEALLERHPHRLRNPGVADWTLLVGRFVIAYNHPSREDRTTAHIVTLWRRR
jgi:hypothetical protein